MTLSLSELYPVGDPASWPMRMVSERECHLIDLAEQYMPNASPKIRAEFIKIWLSKKDDNDDE